MVMLWDHITTMYVFVNDLPLEQLRATLWLASKRTYLDC